MERETEEGTNQLQVLFSQAKSMEAAIKIDSMALVRKLAKPLMVDLEYIELTKPMKQLIQAIAGKSMCASAAMLAEEV